jgi:acetyl-CoA C-acetyltransferase
MECAYVYDALRTPRGRGRPDGGLHEVAPVELIATLLRELGRRHGLQDDAVDDMVLGCVTQVGDQGANIAKVAALYAGLSSRVSGVTLNRYCSSGLDACNFAAMKVMTGQDELVLGGGVESMSRVEMLSDRGSFYTDPELIRAARFVPMGVAADLIANMDAISRRECDAYAVRSQQRAGRARDEGRFRRSLVPVKRCGDGVAVTADEAIRAEVTVEQLAGLEPLFGPYARHYEPAFRQAFPGLGLFEPIHHKGSCPAVVDGASLVLIGSAAAGVRRELQPRARIRAMANASGNELLALTGGIDAARKVLARAGMTFDDLDVIEFNEAFASTSVKFLRDTGVDPELFNANGGAISLGHPMGASGGMLVGMALDELERRDGNIALVSVSGAAGIGTAALLERV